LGRVQQYAAEVHDRYCNGVLATMKAILDCMIPWQNEIAEELVLHEESCVRCFGKNARKTAALLIDEDAFDRPLQKKPSKLRRPLSVENRHLGDRIQP
jgi:hypothetical protein